MARLLKLYIYIYFTGSEISLIFLQGQESSMYSVGIIPLIETEIYYDLKQKGHPFDLFQTHELFPHASQWLILALSGLSWLCDCPTKTFLSC